MNGIFQHLMEASGGHAFDDVLVENVRARIKKRCETFPVHVHKRHIAEQRLEEVAKEAIVEVFQEEFPNALFPVAVRRNWPSAQCIICDDEAVIRFSFSPEMDALRGGMAEEPVRIVVQRRPPNIINRAIQGVLNRAPRQESAPAKPPAPKPAPQPAYQAAHVAPGVRPTQTGQRPASKPQPPQTPPPASGKPIRKGRT